jgi:hypothetical protein
MKVEDRDREREGGEDVNGVNLDIFFFREHPIFWHTA